MCKDFNSIAGEVLEQEPGHVAAATIETLSDDEGRIVVNSLSNDEGRIVVNSAATGLAPTPDASPGGGDDYSATVEVLDPATMEPTAVTAGGHWVLAWWCTERVGIGCLRGGAPSGWALGACVVVH